VSNLSQLIGQIESGNNPNAPLTDYAGNVSANAQFQQSQAYINQYGAGAAGIDNQAQQLLNNNSSATLGDFYSAYNHGSVLPWASYSARFPLQANNFLTNAQAAGYDQNTPLSQLVGGGAAGGSTASGTGDYVSINPDNGNFDDITGIPVAGVNAPGASTFPNDPATAVSSGDLSSLMGGASSSSTLPSDPATAVSSGDLSSLMGGGGLPVNLTDETQLPQDVKGAGSAIQTGAQNAATGIAGTLASLINSIEQYTTSAFVMFALVVLGVIFISYGLRLFGNRMAAA
jgi:hypothetical protein